MPPANITSTTSANGNSPATDDDADLFYGADPLSAEARIVLSQAKSEMNAWIQGAVDESTKQMKSDLEKQAAILESELGALRNAAELLDLELDKIKTDFTADLNKLLAAGVTKDELIKEATASLSGKVEEAKRALERKRERFRTLGSSAVDLLKKFSGVPL